MTRSWAQMEAFAKECKRIEKEGGDVLGYIRENWPSYTPRGTWYNLQRECLGRKPHQMTEGRPKKIEKEETEVKRHGDAVEMAMSVIQVHKKGGDVRKHLLEHGYGDPAKWLCNIKFRFKTDHPEIYAELKDITLGRGPRTKAEEPVPEPEAKKPSGNQGKKAKGAETVVRDGKEYEVFVRDENPDGTVTDRKITTCCAPAPPSGVTVPDELPEEPSLKIAAVRSAVCDGYKYERVFGIGNQDNVALVWRDPVCRGENSLIFSVKNWLQIAKEIPQMLKQLGLI